MTNHEIAGGTQHQDPRPLAFFEAIHESFLAAEHGAQNTISLCYRIAGHVVCLRFAGPALLPYVTPALAHLAAASTSIAAFTICLWDSESTHTALPRLPWSQDDLLPQGAVRGYNSRRIATAFQGEPHSLSVIDREAGLAVYCVRAAADVHSDVQASPLHTILHWYLDGPELQFVHAGAVGTESGAVLLAGKGGSGKTTTALACLEDGLDYLGDNHVAVVPGPEPLAWSLYNSSKLTTDSLQRLPYLAPYVRNPDRQSAEKALVILQDRYPGRLPATLPVLAIVLPRLGNASESRLVACSRAAALSALAPSSILQLPNAGDGALRKMVDLVRRLPCYTLEIGQDSSRVPGLVSRLLRELSTSVTR